MSGLIGNVANKTGGTGGSGGGGLSGLDLSMIEQALGLGSEAIHNRYAQLGLGVPSGDPAQAAASGTNLTSAGPSTMETTDIQGLGNIAQAALGQLQTANTNNPGVPGSVASQGQNITNLGQMATNAGFSENLNSNPGQGQTPTDQSSG